MFALHADVWFFSTLQKFIPSCYTCEVNITGITSCHYGKGIYFMRVLEYIKEHREDENPFECVILPDGSVDAPQPSHIEKLAQIAGEDKISLNKKMEKNMEPLFFMVEYTGCMLVWETRVVEPSHPTKEQEETLELLHDSAMLSPVCKREQAGAQYEDCVRRIKGYHEKEKQKGNSL